MRPMIAFGMFFTALLLVPSLTASASSPTWTVDVGPGYITTAPAVDDRGIYVRTSGFWTGEERPEVLAFTRDGEERWRFSNADVVQHDMAPLLLVPAGQGECGTWPDMVLVGWANGRYDALSASTGEALWNITTPSIGWGITGSSILDGDEVVFPGRASLHRACLADGQATLDVPIGEGWRNGVVRTATGYWVGDEAGVLWHIGDDGAAVEALQLNGSIRHAPLVIDNGLLLHVQHTTSSTIFHYDFTTVVLTNLTGSGASPAVPTAHDNFVFFGDDSGVTSVRCNPVCAVVDRHQTTVNGEMVWTPFNSLQAPVNTPDGGWIDLAVNNTGAFTSRTFVTTPHDGYGTAAPGFGNNLRAYGNDAGVLMVYLDDAPSSPTSSYDAQPLFGALLVALTLGAVSGLASKNRTHDAWRLFSLFLVVLALLLLPDLSSSWNQSLTRTEPAAPEDEWNPQWPEAWLGTQVVVMEFENEVIEIGGLVGHATVLELTQAAAQQHNITLEVESTNLGPLLVSINGTSGAGWEYFVNGARGALAMDDAPVQTPVVLVWRLA